ncbi:hypothetical protein BDV26DRAFT_254740 [Aspergillus bertholletiae]|uniref:Uncharacterized protein n=1 Tax=Aspergillus bertholletiae TaxID=1226010 RepID=A0A5N7BJA6_9EURO|nr:hypothetical protein BDV26DRAFT_254740 [Aspergillus bertholletiae]
MVTYIAFSERFSGVSIFTRLNSSLHPRRLDSLKAMVAGNGPHDAELIACQLHDDVLDFSPSQYSIWLPITSQSHSQRILFLIRRIKPPRVLPQETPRLCSTGIHPLPLKSHRECPPVVRGCLSGHPWRLLGAVNVRQIAHVPHGIGISMATMLHLTVKMNVSD